MIIYALLARAHPKAPWVIQLSERNRGTVAAERDAGYRLQYGMNNLKIMAVKSMEQLACLEKGRYKR